MEGWYVIIIVVTIIRGQEREYLGDLHKASRPSVTEQKRDAVRLAAFLMDEMDFERFVSIYRNGGGKLGKLVEFGLCAPPIESGLPVLN